MSMREFRRWLVAALIFWLLGFVTAFGVWGHHSGAKAHPKTSVTALRPPRTRIAGCTFTQPTVAQERARNAQCWMEGAKPHTIGPPCIEVRCG